MNSFSPRIAIPEPSATDPDYSRQSWPVYAKAVEQAGGTAVKVPLGESPAAVAGLIGSCSGVLLPGSSADLDPEKYGEQPSEKCNPKDGMRESADELLLQDAFNLRKPIFGICYGMQSLNVWKSGSLIQICQPSKRRGLTKRRGLKAMWGLPRSITGPAGRCATLIRFRLRPAPCCPSFSLRPKIWRMKAIRSGSR